VVALGAVGLGELPLQLQRAQTAARARLAPEQRDTVIVILLERSG
jgi:hypothetical protein